MVHMCFIDESGDAAACSPEHPDAPPVFILVGITVPAERAKSLTWDFLQMKKTFEPRLEDVRFSELVRHEIKGSTLRRDLRASGRKRRRRALGILDKTLTILEDHDCLLAGEVVVKEPGQQIFDTPMYGKAVQYLATTLESALAAADTTGLLILDSRTKVKNEGNVHGITTRRFRKGGDLFPHLLEAPVFGHSDTHVPLQIADLIASALVFPIACNVYCADHTWCRHVEGSEHFEVLRERFGARLQSLEYRYLDHDGRRAGGFQVEDHHGRHPTHLLFRP